MTPRGDNDTYAWQGHTKVRSGLMAGRSNSYEADAARAPSKKRCNPRSSLFGLCGKQIKKIMGGVGL